MQPGHEHLNVLIVEDSPTQVACLRALLAHATYEVYRIEVATSIKEAAAWLLDPLNHWDAILLDLELPDSAAMETPRRVQQMAPFTPIVIVSGHNSDEVALEAMACGVDDFLVKGLIEPEQLILAIRKAVVRARARAVAAPLMSAIMDLVRSCRSTEERLTRLEEQLQQTE